MIKELDDYLESIEAKYPHIPKEELKKVLEWGFQHFNDLTKRGADISIYNWIYGAYCGRMFIDDYIRARYIWSKTSVKHRLLYKYAQEIYDGVYYFGLSDEELKICESKINRKQKRKRTFVDLKLYKIKEESFLDKKKTHFFMIYYPIDMGYMFTINKITTEHFKHFADRDAKGKIVTI